MHARVGAPTTPAQQRVLDLLESQIDRSLRAPGFKADDLGRAADKFSSLARVLEELPHNSYDGQDLLAFAAVLHDSFLPYSHLRQGSCISPKVDVTAFQDSPAKPNISKASVLPSDTDPQHTIDQASARPRAACAPKFLNFRAGSHLPVVADRIKWKHGPTFDPSPYLDPLLARAVAEPALLRRPSSEWPALPPARVHCSKQELLKLGEKWDRLGSVVLRSASEVDWDEAVGLFSVAKSAAHDRLIVNPVVSNSRSHTISRFSCSLAPGSLLTLLSLAPGVGFRFSADDLSDYYYSFRVSPQRAFKNSIRCAFEPLEVSHFRAAEGIPLSGPQIFSLNTMAMGDSLAVEVGQAAHFGVLRQHVGALLPAETLVYRQAVPKGDCVELLAIDDHVCLHKLPLDQIKLQPKLRDSAIFSKATEAYEHVGLNLNDDKKRRNLTQGVVLGAELDGVEGMGPTWAVGLERWFCKEHCSQDAQVSPGLPRLDCNCFGLLASCSLWFSRGYSTGASSLRVIHLFEQGLPRYLFVYAITAVQDAYPQHRNFLTAAWQIDKKWQHAEPGSCRPVLPVAAIRAAISLALLWGWFRWACVVILGFLAMLHPAELVGLTRRDLVFPEDNLGHTSSLFVHLRSWLGEGVGLGQRPWSTTCRRSPRKCS